MASKLAENIKFIRKVVMFALASVVSIAALLLSASDAFWQSWGLICLAAFGANGAEHFAKGIRKPRPLPGNGINTHND